MLRALESQDDGLSLGEVAALVDLPRSTVQRIVAALAEEQLLIAASPKSRVKLGPAIIRLANATSININEMVRPYLENLSRDLEETVDLSMVQGRYAVFIDQIQGKHRLRAVSAIGEKFPMHCSACGKALLATMSKGQIEKHLDPKLGSFTSNTITNKRALLSQIDHVRETGIATDEEEYTEGISAIGVAFRDPLGKHYAISIPAPTVRFTRLKNKFESAIVQCKKQIIETLGEKH